MDAGNTTKSKIITFSRWALFVPIALIQAGAFLEGEYITSATGIILGLFLTVHQDKVRKVIPLPYIIILITLIVMFLTGSYIDMKNSNV